MPNFAAPGANGSNITEAVKRSLTVIQYWSALLGFGPVRLRAEFCLQLISADFGLFNDELPFSWVIQRRMTG